LAQGILLHELVAEGTCVSPTMADSTKTEEPKDKVNATGQPEGDTQQPAVPKVLFVLGGPGAGKGTQCTNIVENFKSWAHISAGDCLRAERQDPSSADGELINTFIKEGQIVPVRITVKLLQKAMAAHAKDGKTHFLIDGYPRNLDNVEGWEQNVGDAAKVCGVLFFDANEEELEKRLLSRGQTSGRVDDNLESIRKRFKTYEAETMPIINRYKQESKVYTIDGLPPAEDVWKVTQQIISEIEKAE